jgi:hypothetical protein
MEGHNGKASPLTDCYAAVCVGVEAFVVFISIGMVAEALWPDLVSLKVVMPTRLVAVLWGLAFAGLAYAVFAPGRRYRRWASEFAKRSSLATARPAAMEIRLHAGVFLFLLVCLHIAWVLRWGF